MTEVAICEKNILVREGLKAILTEVGLFSIVAECTCFVELKRQLTSTRPNILIIDPACITVDELKSVTTNFSLTRVLCISESAVSSEIKACLATGVHGFIFKDCDRKEVLDALVATREGEKFFCGKAIEALTSDTQNPVNCQPVKVSSREAEIIRLIAEGYTNKEIADRLCLSSHTITTHRKNIMNKLGLSSTAGLVMFAIRENLIQAN